MEGVSIDPFLENEVKPNASRPCKAESKTMEMEDCWQEQESAKINF